MKKILALLILSPLLSAEKINLSCETYSTFDLIDMTSSETTGIESIVINTKLKTVTMDSGRSFYNEDDNKINWYKIWQIDLGDELGIMEYWYLDRVSGELETHFKLQKYKEGYTYDDFEKHWNLDNYETSLIHSSKCSKVEALF